MFGLQLGKLLLGLKLAAEAFVLAFWQQDENTSLVSVHDNWDLRGWEESRMSEAEAQEIIAQARLEGSISKTRQKTLAYIYARYELTREAKEQIKAVL